MSVLRNVYEQKSIAYLNRDVCYRLLLCALFSNVPEHQ